MAKAAKRLKLQMALLKSALLCCVLVLCLDKAGEKNKKAYTNLVKKTESLPSCTADEWFEFTVSV